MISKVVDETPFVAAVSLVYGSLLYVCALSISMEIGIDSTKQNGHCMKHKAACVAFKEFVDIYGVFCSMLNFIARSFM